MQEKLLHPDLAPRLMYKIHDYTPTGCCALVQMRGDNSTTNKDVEEFFKLLTIQKQFDWLGTPVTGNGATSVFCIVSPGEKRFEDVLKNQGFKNVNKFKRRSGYDDGILKMYIKNIL